MSVDWVQVGITFGVPTLILGFLGWFWVAHAWPFVKEQVEKSRTAQEQALNRFMAAVDKFQATDAEMARSLGQIASTLEHLRRDAPRRGDRNP